MGKKKDKAAKAKKKKSGKGPVLEAETSSIAPAEPEPEPEPESESEAEPEARGIQYAEHVTAQDVMELVNSLSHDIERLDKSNQALQRQVAQNQKSPQLQYMLLAVITLIMGVGIVTAGYYSARANARIDDSMSIVSTRLERMKAQVESMSTSMSTMSSDMSSLNTTLVNLSANLTTIEQDINKVASDVGKLNTGTASRAYDPYRMGYTRSPR